ncbi:Syntaxin-32 [Camellia lanceoleosa]|uniref:Syntaxin-32 n=1 Tax=Camellia lanceoleosa TaxID=1840588 RepID=A0ACC0INA0_9ERIC|nr:Syntaxin-32 [Camellia lanceoleosa]
MNEEAMVADLDLSKLDENGVTLACFGIVAKRTSVFDDPTMEIQELTAVVKQDITALNSAVVDLQLLCNSQIESGNISSDTTTHSATVVDNLKNRLMSATKEFKEVLTMRTENLKVHENRRQLFSSTASKDFTNPFVRQRPLAARAAASASASPPPPPPPPWANGSASSSQLFPRKQADGESQPLLQQQQHQQQQQMVPLQDSYMQSRAEALHNVESTIHELGNIFTQLATMVSQQGELAIRLVHGLLLHICQTCMCCEQHNNDDTLMISHAFRLSLRV